MDRVTKTMPTKGIKRTVSTSEDPYGSDSASAKDEERTIPFLRRLVAMLSENDDVISFHPGSTENGQVSLGRIDVHDRLKMEADVLPKYFNHSSFASLRRQLNYFRFTRLGKGRQRGASYCNEGVIELDDILRLKRRSAVAGPTPAPQQQAPQHTEEPTPASSTKRERSVSFSSASSTERQDSTTSAKKARPTIVSPRSSPVHNLEEIEQPKIILDLTMPRKKVTPEVLQRSCNPCEPLPSQVHHLLQEDEDVLAGGRALLSFSRGFAFQGQMTV